MPVPVSFAGNPAGIWAIVEPAASTDAPPIAALAIGEPATLGTTTAKLTTRRASGLIIEQWAAWVPRR